MPDHYFDYLQATLVRVSYSTTLTDLPDYSGFSTKFEGNTFSNNKHV